MPPSITPEAEATTELESDRLRLAVEEAMQRLDIRQAEQEALVYVQQQHGDGLRVFAVMRACSIAVEQQETMARMALAEEQLAFAMGLAAGLPVVVGQLAEAQSAAQASRGQVEVLEEALEEREMALAQMGRDLESVQDSQMASDAEAQQRQVGRTEGERRAAILGEQRAAWGMLQDIEGGSRLTAAQHAMERLVMTESMVRQAIAEEQASSLDLSSVVQGLVAQALSAIAATQESALSERHLLRRLFNC